MNLTIQIDETKFKDVVENELKAFTKEELHDILTEAIKQYLSESSVVHNLFVERRVDNWGRSEDRPTKFLEDICRTIDLSIECKEISNAIKYEITNNSTAVVANLIGKCISRQLFESWQGDSIIRGEVQDMVCQLISSMSGGNH